MFGARGCAARGMSFPFRRLTAGKNFFGFLSKIETSTSINRVGQKVHLIHTYEYKYIIRNK